MDIRFIALPRVPRVRLPYARGMWVGMVAIKSNRDNKNGPVRAVRGSRSSSREKGSSSAGVKTCDTHQ